jgi:predicted PurR-regulated permease PerM
MGLASVLFITFFFLKERNLFMTSAKKLIPDGHEDKALNFRKINYLLSRYFIGLQLFIVFVLYFTVLLLFVFPMHL